MGFFQTIKNKLGIGGVSVQLQAPGQVPKDTSKVEGKMTLTTKSDQEVMGCTVKIYEEYTTGRGENKKTSTFELGKINIPGSFKIKTGEIKEITFSLPFSLIKSNNQQLQDKGGALGTLGKIGSFANNESSSYFINAEIDVKSAALDPSDKKEIKFV